MKKILLTITGFVVTLLTMAQSPNLMNYQGVARNAVGNVLPSQPIGLRLSILSGGPTGSVVYQETRNVTTNAFGLFNVVVGSPGAITTTGTIAGINWTAFGIGSGTKYLQVEIDAVGGTNYFNVGSTQLVSVPYALNAGSATPVGPAGGDLTGTYPNPTVAKLQGRAVSAAAPANKNLLMWDAGTISWIPATAAQAGIVSGTGTLNYVPKWTPDGATLGNSQIFDDGTNVGIGTTTPGAGLVVSGAGIWKSAIGIQNTTSGMEWRMNVSGTTFGITKIPGSTFTPLQLFSTGGMDFSSSAGTSIARLLDNGNVGIGTTAPQHTLSVGPTTADAQTVMVRGFGNGPANWKGGAAFGNTNATVIMGELGGIATLGGHNSNLTAWANLSINPVAGNVGIGLTTPTARLHTLNSTGVTILGENNGNGDAVVGSNTGTSGRGGYFQVTNTANVSDAIRAETNGSGASWAIRAISTGTNGAGLFQQTNAANTSNNVQSNQAGLGRAGLFNATNTATTAAALEANSSSVNVNASAITGNMLSTTGAANSTGLRGNNNSTNDFGIGVWGGHNGSGWGVYGFASQGGGAGWAAGVYADMLPGATPGGSAVRGNNYNTGGFGGYFIDNNGGATSRALRTAGKLQLSGIGEVNNYLLRTDALGNATWVNPAVLLSGNFWTTTGNAGTVNGTNFIGTTDNIPFNVRVNNQKSGSIDQNTGNNSWGYLSLLSNPTGTVNNAFGSQNLLNLTSGSANTAIGHQNLFNTTTPNFNTAIGYQNLPFNTTGGENTGVGIQALFQNTTGVDNVGVGFLPLQFNTTGSRNSAVGYGPLNVNTTGSNNTANGALALLQNTTGSNNTAMGNSALINNTTGSNNTAVGAGANVSGGNLTNATAIGFNAVVSANNSLVLGSNANVGIGISNPVAKLHVNNANLTNAGNFNNTNAGNSVGTLSAFNNSSNNGAVGLYAISTGGSGYGPIFASGIVGESFSQRGILGVSNANVGVHGASNTGNGVLGESYASTGNAGVFGSGLAVNNYGVVGNAAPGTGAGGYFTGGTTALRTLGGVQLTGIGEAAGRVLTSDATGNATWQAATSTLFGGITVRQFSSTVSIPSSITTPITQWQTIMNEDGGSNYNSVTGEYTIPVAGVYQVNAQLLWNAFSSAAAFCQVRIHVNGAFDNQDTNPNAATGQQTSAVNYARRFAAGSIIQVQAFQNSGANQSLNGALFGQNFSIQFLHN